MKMVMGIIRSGLLEQVVDELEKIKIMDLTIAEVKGIGEQVSINSAYTIHKLILIIVPDEKVDQVTDIVLKSARTGLAGDGIITVFPVDQMIKIRTLDRSV